MCLKDACGVIEPADHIVHPPLLGVLDFGDHLLPTRPIHVNIASLRYQGGKRIQWGAVVRKKRVKTIATEDSILRVKRTLRGDLARRVQVGQRSGAKARRLRAGDRHAHSVDWREILARNHLPTKARRHWPLRQQAHEASIRGSRK